MFNSRMLAVYNLSDMDEIVTAMIEHMKQQIENPALKDSKFVFDGVIGMNIDFHRLNMTRGSSYIPLPEWLAKKGTIINPKNSDMECFKWAVIAATKWREIGDHPKRISKLRRYEDDFDWDGIKFPPSTGDIKKFESRNEITINILALEHKKVYICRKGKEYDRVANLMLITGRNEKHYIVVKSLSRLLRSSNNKNEKAQYFCIHCLQGFNEKKSRDEHLVYCRDNEAVRKEMPNKKPIVKYSDGQCQFKVPFMMYADFESILEPIQGASNNPNISLTRGVNIHMPSGWCIYSHFSYRKVTNPLAEYRGPDCIEKFCKHIIPEAKRLYNSFLGKPMSPLTKSHLKEYARATECHICFKPFSEEKRKVRDHCHYTGLYRGAAHSSCNLQYKIPNYIPVVFHNLAGYDAHLFIRELAKYTTGMGVIAKNMEDYISFSIKVEVDKYVDKEGNERTKEMELRFIDSIKFMSSSLDSLVNNLARGGLWGFENYNCHKCKLLIQKGIYPYEYMDSWDKFEETSLPRIEKFYSNLNMSGVSDADYEHACSVWREFKIRNIGEYHDLYLRTEVILLANVFESFGRVCLENYGLDPSHLYTAPGLAWKACFKKTGVKLKVLLDPDMLLMFERGIRGGIMQSIHRWAAVNNPNMGSEYDKNKPTKYLQYLDANNLCGWAMSQPLPNGGFHWVELRKDWSVKTIAEELATKKNYGYLLEVDVAYPKELHDYHNDIPFMCAKMKINGVEKLVPNLYYKKKYVIHIKALKQAIDHGLVLERIHRCIEFNQ